MKNLLGDSDAKLGREDVFKLAIWNDSLRGISNDNRVIVLPGLNSNFPEYDVPTSQHS
jgi:hypothetical protein